MIASDADTGTEQPEQGDGADQPEQGDGGVLQQPQRGQLRDQPKLVGDSIPKLEQHVNLKIGRRLHKFTASLSSQFKIGAT